MKTKTSHSWKALQKNDALIGFAPLTNLTQGDNKNREEKYNRVISTLYKEVFTESLPFIILMAAAVFVAILYTGKFIAYLESMKIILN